MCADKELYIDSIMEEEWGVDTLQPYQVQIGVRAGDLANYALVDLNAEYDDEETEN